MTTPQERQPVQPEGSEVSGLRPAMDFCQEPSQQWLDACEDEGGDPRAAEGAYAIGQLMLNGGWSPPWDSRQFNEGQRG